LKNIIYSRAPVRICDIGGWTDTWFYPKGAIFNICVDLYSCIRIVPNNTNKINIISENLNLRTEIQDFNKIEYDGNLDLLKAAVKRTNIEKGLDIYIRTDAPPGCGTGTSASVAVALIAALTRFSHKNLSPKEMANLAHKLEIEELKLESGIQDQYAAALGGINFMEINYPSAKISRIELEDEQIINLENHLILVYLSSRSSNQIHKSVIENYRQGDDSTIRSLEIIKNCAYEMKEAIYSKNLDLMGKIMNKNWEAQKNLHPLMVNPIIKKIERMAEKYGAIGFKLNGAGGGGSATILSGIRSEFRLKKKIVEEGFQILPMKINFNGVQVWTAEKNE
jgi:D-glycero-alpha-D-manno-heptose-7-phosphate kinase